MDIKSICKIRLHSQKGLKHSGCRIKSRDRWSVPQCVDGDQGEAPKAASKDA